MKLSDLFLPKIARSDPKVREDAVLKCKDADLLKRVIKNDEDERVRQTAQKRLETLMA
jgi:Asp-tRNA(Asn)/Glu-tRNA(Gln) amidotransferase C subunit